MEKEEIKEILNLAQCEIRAMYKRLGIRGSNVLDKVDSAYEALRQLDVIKSVCVLCSCGADHIVTEGDILPCRKCTEE